MDSKDIILPLIKEIVKNEVKKQVKEEIIRLVKAGVLTAGSALKPKPIVESVKSQTPNKIVSRNITQTALPAAPKVFSKNSMINEILNKTKPFTNAERAEGTIAGIGGGASVLDLVKPTPNVETGWSEMRVTSDNINVPGISQEEMMVNQEAPQFDSSTGTGQQMNAISKALNRDYRELVKRFKK
jgi:hypothetical protein